MTTRQLDLNGPRTAAPVIEGNPHECIYRSANGCTGF